jgi:hypothetical protein
MNSLLYVKNSRALVVAGLLGTFVATGCGRSDPASSNNDGTVVYSTSFETNGSFDLSGWMNGAGAVESHDVPSGGGTRSPVLPAMWGVGRLMYSISVPAGTHRYELSCWAKTIGTVRGGYIWFGNAYGDTVAQGAGVQVTDTVWTKYVVSDTLDMNGSNQIIISLNGAFSQLATGEAHFDLLTLRRLD